MTHPSSQAPTQTSLVMFNVAQRRYAVPLTAVERILPARKPKPLRGTSRKILGLVQLPGQSIPVFSLRRHLGLEERRIESTDRLLIVRSGHRTLALVAEEIESDLTWSVRGRGGERSGAAVPADCLHAKGLVQVEDGLRLIADVGRLLDAKDEFKLDRALRERACRSLRQAPVRRSGALSTVFGDAGTTVH